MVIETDIANALEAALAGLMMPANEPKAVDEIALSLPPRRPESIDRPIYHGPRRRSRRSYSTEWWTKVEAVTITENAAKSGIEIRFPEKPAEAILAMLKRTGWEWSGTYGCWYIKASDAARRNAMSIKTMAAAN
jgi:hypothetical protein